MVGKGTASPFSTGGGGYEYERRVAATYLAAMICGEDAPGADGTVTEVKFQQRGAGHLLDDLVVVSDKGGRTSRLSLQVKHGLRVGASSEFRGVIVDCWRMFAGSEGAVFDRSADRLGIVVNRIADAAGRHCLPVLDAARASGDSGAFWSGMRGGGHSKHRDEFVDSIREAIAGSAGTDATDDDLWEFLRVIRIVVLDMDGPGALGRVHAEGMCRRALYEPGEGEAAKLFDALRGVAADLAPAGGSIGVAALRSRLSAFDLAGHAGIGADAGRLNAHSRTVMAGIGKAIGNKAALDRAPLLASLEGVVKASAVTIIHGEPFAGKSALARLFAEKMSGRGTVMFLGTECLGGSGSPEAFFNSLGVHCSLEDILETHGTAPHRYIVIDGLDRIPYEPEKAQVAKGLLTAISDYNARAAALAPAPADEGAAWKIIVTSRNTEMKAVARTVVQRCGGARTSLLEVDPLTDEEINEVCRQLPQLGGAIRGRLGVLLSLPGYLDMIARWLPATSEGVPGAVGEGWLFDLFWNEAVLWRVGMREGRGHGRDREKILVDMAERAYRGLPPMDPHDLDPDAVDGLLTDGLARIVGNRLAFAHDVIEDYALARMIEWAQPRRPLLEGDVNTRRLARPLRICAAKMLEADASAYEWESLFEDCRHLENGNVWARECLLGAADSDEARSNLDAVSGALLRDGGALLAVLLAALPSAFLKDDPHAVRAARDRGAAGASLHPAYYRLPRDERFAPVLLFALDNMDHLGGAATAQFIRAAAKWSRSGKDRGLKTRIAEYAARHADWLHDGEEILCQNCGESNETKCLVAAIILYSSDAAPDLVKKFVSGNPTIICNDHFRRGLIEERGWVHLCKFLPDVAVDVLSRIMCTGPSALGPLKNIPEIRDAEWTDLASPYEGPFLTLLASHSTHGLNLVHRLLNHITDQWRREQKANSLIPPPRTPLPQTIRLNSGVSVDVYGDEDAFAWCGHTRLAPDLAASALMALEVWLDGQVERGEEPVAALFDSVLQPTNSAAVVGACCAVALRHMDKSAEAVLPILANPAFWIMDAERLEADREAANIIHLQLMASNAGEASNEKYELALQHADERCKLGHLSDFVPQILLDGSDATRTKMQEALAAFSGRVPTFFKNDADNDEVMKKRRRDCELWSERAHRNNYKRSPNSAGAQIVFDEERFLAADEKDGEGQRPTYNKALDFTAWSNNSITKDRIGPNFTTKSALERAAEITGGGPMPSPPDLRAAGAPGRTNLLGALMIQRWDEAAEMDIAGTSQDDLEAVPNAIDTRDKDVRSQLHCTDRATARALPHYYLQGNGGRSAKNAIRRLAGAHDAGVVDCLMHGLRALWNHEDELVLECVAKARLRSRGKKGKAGRSRTDWEGYAAALPALHNVPPASGGTEGRLKRVVDDMLDDTIATFGEIERGRNHRMASVPFYNIWCPYFFKVLESYIAGRPAHRDDILAKILSNWEAAPHLLAEFMRWTLFWGKEEGRRDDLLATWKRLVPEVIESKLLAGRCNDNGTRRLIIALLVFVDSTYAANSAKAVDVVGGFTGEISSWCKAFAGDKHAIEAIAPLLDSAPPALLLSHGIGWLWQVLQPAARSDISGSAVAMLSHILHKASACGRPGGASPNLSGKYAWLVDYLVTFNDPVAESLRDEGANPYVGTNRRPAVV